MISVKEEVEVRLEITFKVLVGELRVMEDDLERMSLRQFIDVWSPETKDARIMLRLIDKEEKLDGTRGKSKKAKKEISSPSNSEVHDEGE